MKTAAAVAKKTLSRSSPRPKPKPQPRRGPSHRVLTSGERCKPSRIEQVLFPDLRTSLSRPTHFEPLVPERLVRNLPRTADRIPFLITRPDTRNGPAVSTGTSSPSVKQTLNMHNYLKVVSTPTADTPGTSIILHFDDKRYIFGAIAEGTQRAITQRGVGLKNVENIFVSGPISWRSIGGLLGLILTVADVMGHKMIDKTGKQLKVKHDRLGDVIPGRASALRIHGGRNLSHMLATARRFVFRQGMPIEPYEICGDSRHGETTVPRQPDWQDNNINLWYMPIESSDAETTSSRPFKRSRVEMGEEAEAPTSSDVAQKDNDKKLVDNVVMSMFSSKWSMDALIEMPLHEVRLPAKIFVRDEHGHLQEYTGPVPGKESDGDLPDIKVLVRRPWPASQVVDLPRTKPSRQSICYVVKGHTRRGKFNAEAAKKWNLDKRDYRRLSNYETVVDKDGKTVTPKDVLGDDIPGSGFAVLDVPDMTYFTSLVERPEWSDPEIFKEVKELFWILGPGVASDPRFTDFLAKKQQLYRHIVSSPDTSPNQVALESSAAQAYKLHSIDPERFPLPAFNNFVSMTGQSLEDSDLYKAAKTGLTIQYAPQYMHQDDLVVKQQNIEGIALSTIKCDVKQLLDMVQKAKTKAVDPAFLAGIEEVEKDIPNRDAEIIALGTGSAQPSKYRNVSATLVRVPGYGSYLFDAGENTLGQMSRVFGNKLPSVLQDLKAIWISHLHADHHLGTTSVISAWNQETLRSKQSARLHLASHRHMLDWLREYSDVEDFGYSRLTFSHFQHRVHRGNKQVDCEPKVFRADETQELGLERIDACFVDHCFGAMATVFTWPSGLKIAYSGDCRPSDQFVKIGQGATVLIHESTFDDELQGDALAKKHSTMSEAIDIGRRMGARRTLLTHFSQRYQKFPNLGDDTFELIKSGKAKEKLGAVEGKEKAKLDEVVLVAFDGMRVRLGDFRKAQVFLPALQKSFEGVTD